MKPILVKKNLQHEFWKTYFSKKRPHSLKTPYKGRQTSRQIYSQHYTLNIEIATRKKMSQTSRTELSNFYWQKSRVLNVT